MQEEWTPEGAIRLSQQYWRKLAQWSEGGSQPWDPEITELRDHIRLLGLNLLFDFPPHQRARSFDHLWHRTSYHWLLSHRQIVTALHDDLKGAETPAARARARTQLTDVIGRYGEALRRELSTWKKLLDKVISVHGLWGLVHRKINRDVILCHNVTNPDPPTTIDSDRINMVYEALTNLGDLYRYRDDLDRVVTVLGVTPRRNHDVNDEQCYRAAARLCPDKGSAYGKLGLVAVRRANLFDQIYFQLRGYDVLRPFDPKQGPLRALLTRHIASGNWEQRRDSAQSRTDLAGLTDDMLFVCATLYSGEHLGRVSELEDSVTQRLFALLRTRQVPGDFLVKLVIIFISTHRASRPDISTAGHNREYSRRQDLALAVLIALFGVMFEVCLQELSDAVEKRDIHGIRPGPLETMSMYLPALRIASKWIKINSEHLVRQRNQNSTLTFGHIGEMWQQYHDYTQLVVDNFSFYNLPAKTGPFPEDVDLRGYLPLAPVLADLDADADDQPTDEGDANEEDSGRAEEYEEETLQRLSDFLFDARLNLDFAESMGWLDPLVMPAFELSTTIGFVTRSPVDDQYDPVNEAFRSVLENPCVDQEEDIDEEGSSLPHSDEGANKPTGDGQTDASDNDSESEVIVFTARGLRQAAAASASTPSPSNVPVALPRVPATSRQTPALPIPNPAPDRASYSAQLRMQAATSSMGSLGLRAQPASLWGAIGDSQTGSGNHPTALRSPSSPSVPVLPPGLNIRPVHPSHPGPAQLHAPTSPPQYGYAPLYGTLASQHRSASASQLDLARRSLGDSPSPPTPAAHHFGPNLSRNSSYVYSSPTSPPHDIWGLNQTDVERGIRPLSLARVSDRGVPRPNAEAYSSTPRRTPIASNRGLPSLSSVSYAGPSGHSPSLTAGPAVGSPAVPAEFARLWDTATSSLAAAPTAPSLPPGLGLTLGNVTSSARPRGA